ncbi:MAG: cytochrome c maturation protein CcmE domain-containing protein [Candidatus Thorarchaeota archaeon]|jgi:cytochrome c-type biogenesis protein CcmE
MKKKTRMMLIAAVLVVVVGLVSYAMLNLFVDPYISVDAVVDNPDAYRGRVIQVKGTLQPGSISINPGNVTLILAGNSSTILVIVDTDLPSLTDGQEMAAIGMLEDGEELAILASEILTQCSSKYTAVTP